MEARISGTTKLFGLIGSPVSHSASPAMQNYGFQVRGVDEFILPLILKKRKYQNSSNHASVKYPGM